MSAPGTGRDIPRRLNDPPRMFWWDLDVSLLVMACTAAGMLFGYFLTGALLGLLCASAYSRIKSGRHPAYALHLMYWHLPPAVTGLKYTPPSWAREMTG